MKKLLLILLCLPMLFISCTDNFEEGKKLYNEGINNKSKTLLDKAYYKFSNVPYSHKDYKTAQLLLKSLDSLEENRLYQQKQEESLIVEIENKKKEAEKKRELDKKEKLKSLNKLKKDFDDVSGITLYKQPYFTHYPNTNLISIYMAKKDRTKWLILRMSYTGDNWIFFEKAILSYDGKSKTIPFDKYTEKETENSGGNVWEWIDVPIIVNKSLENYLREFAKSKNAKMRLSGKYTKTRTLTYNERRGILDILNGYDALDD